MSSDEAILEAEDAFGNMLTEWCLKVSSDEIVKSLSGDGKLVSEELLPRLSFCLLIANSMIVIIAANEVLPQHYNLACNGFHRKFHEAIKERFGIEALIGDFICREDELAALTDLFEYPVNAKYVKTSFPHLVAGTQKIRTQPMIASYVKSKHLDDSMKMVRFTSEFFSQLFGFNAFNPTTNIIDPRMIFFAQSFSVTLKAGLELLGQLGKANNK